MVPISAWRLVTLGSQQALMLLRASKSSAEAVSPKAEASAALPALLTAVESSQVASLIL